MGHHRTSRCFTQMTRPSTVSLSGRTPLQSRCLPQPQNLLSPSLRLSLSLSHTHPLISPTVDRVSIKSHSLAVPVPPSTANALSPSLLPSLPPTLLFLPPGPSTDQVLPCSPVASLNLKCPFSISPPLSPSLSLSSSSSRPSTDQVSLPCSLGSSPNLKRTLLSSLSLIHLLPPSLSSTASLTHTHTLSL